MHMPQPYSRLIKYFVIPTRNFLYRRSYLPQEVEPGSYPFPRRQVPRVGRKSFNERFQELTQDSSTELIDVGLPFTISPLIPNRSQAKRPELEALARKRLLNIPLDAVHSVSEDTHVPIRRLLAAHHFGIFRDLFGPSYFFVPSARLSIYFAQQLTSSQSNSFTSSASEPQSVDVQPVYWGNLITATVAQTQPIIDLSEMSPENYWTLVMSCPDEPLSFDSHPPPNEYVHWMIANLTGGSCDQVGDEVVSYLPPLPYMGTGFHRYVFTLYRQETGRMDVGELTPENLEGDFRVQRKFHTLEFYRRLESKLTPAGLAFFQSSWDESVRSYFRNVLNALEPVFELEWPDPSVPPQQRFPVADSWTRTRRHPHGLPLINERYGVHNDVSFDVYLDRYRDRKELQEELVLERLQMEGNPLNLDEPRRKRVEYPAAIPMPKGMPSWWTKQEMQRRLRTGRWKHLEGHDG